MKAAPGIAQADHDAAVARLLAARIEQGLEPTVSDPGVLDKAAALFDQRRRGARVIEVSSSAD